MGTLIGSSSQDHVGWEDAPFLARLVGVYTPSSGNQANINLYSFVEQSFDPTTGIPSDAVSGRMTWPQTGSPATSYAIESNNNLLTIPGPTPPGYANPGPYVRVKLKGYVAGVPAYEFSATPAVVAAGWWAQITGQSGTSNLYSWQAIDYITPPAPDTGANNASEVAGNTAVPVGTVGWMTAGALSGSPSTQFIFSADEAAGTSHWQSLASDTSVASGSVTLFSYTAPAAGAYDIRCQLSGLVYANNSSTTNAGEVGIVAAVLVNGAGAGVNYPELPEGTVAWVTIPQSTVVGGLFGTQTGTAYLSCSANLNSGDVVTVVAETYSSVAAVNNSYVMGVGTAAPAYNIVNPPSWFFVGTSGAGSGGSYDAPVYSAPALGFVGDGSTDNSALFHSALTSMAANGGGVLQFPAGTYIGGATWPTNGSNISLMGAGRGVTVLKDTAHGNANSVPGYNTTPMFDITAPASGSLANLRFSGITFQGGGNSDALSSYQAFYLGNVVNNVRWDDCEFLYFRESGIHASPIREISPGVYSTTYGQDLVVDSCNFDFIGSPQMAAETSGGAIAGACARFKILNNTFGAPGTNNIGTVPAIVGSAATITNVAVTSNVATVTANNSFTAGNSVSIWGLTHTVLNGTWTIASANSTSFTFNVTAADITGAADSGSAQQRSILAGVNNAAFASGLTTLTTTANHGFATGTPVLVFGLTNAIFNGIFTVHTVPSTTTLTFSLLPVTVSGVSLTSDVATITTATSHNFIAGDSVTVAGLSNTEFNGTWTVASSPPPTATAFSFSLAHADVSQTSDTGTATLAARASTSDSGYAVQSGNNFHALYIQAQCDAEVRGNRFNGLCSRLHMFSSSGQTAPGTGTEPPVNSIPATIGDNTFDGCYGGNLPHVCWNNPNANFHGNTFHNTGVSVGANNISIKGGNVFFADSALPATGGSAFLFVSAGSSASNVNVQHNTFVSAIPHTQAVVWPVYNNVAGSNEWTVTDNTIDANINATPTPYDIAGVYLNEGTGHAVKRQRIRTHLGQEIVFLGQSCGGGCRVEDNDIESNNSGNWQAFWDASQNPTNLFVGNTVNGYHSSVAALGVIAQHWSAKETTPLNSGGVQPRVGWRCSRNLTANGYWTPGTILPTATVSTTATVAGAMPGDSVQCEFGAAGGNPIFMSGRVTAPNTATIWAFNAGASSVSLGAGNLHVCVRQVWPDWGDAITTASVGSATLSTTTLTPTGPSATMTATVTLSGGNTCQIGDAVAPSCSAIGGNIVSVSGYVSATDTVIVTATNLSGETVTLTSPLISVQTRPQ